MQSLPWWITLALALCCLLLTPRAAPLNTHRGAAGVNNDCRSIILSRDSGDDTDDKRSIQDIVWSCLATIFACTWVSIHPNIPPLGDGSIKKFFRRVGITALALIAPELIVIWALRQWRFSRQLAREYADLGWEQVHRFFAIMGGFMVYDKRGPLHILYPHLPQAMLRRHHVLRISAEEIWDRSKGDVLAKGLVVLQTTWFILQCIARKSQGLAITQMEALTVAFAALNFVIYALWWNKPLGVEHPVHVPMDAESDPALPPSIAIEPSKPPYWLVERLILGFDDNLFINYNDLSPDPAPQIASFSSLSTLDLDWEVFSSRLGILDVPPNEPRPRASAVSLSDLALPEAVLQNEPSERSRSRVSTVSLSDLALLEAVQHNRSFGPTTFHFHESNNFSYPPSLHFNESGNFSSDFLDMLQHQPPPVSLPDLAWPEAVQQNGSSGPATFHFNESENFSSDFLDMLQHQPSPVSLPDPAWPEAVQQNGSSGPITFHFNESENFSTHFLDMPQRQPSKRSPPSQRLRGPVGVPTFYTGWTRKDVIHSSSSSGRSLRLFSEVFWNFIGSPALLVAPIAVAFGTIHCIAWNSVFTTNIERRLWHVSTIAIITTPFFPVVNLFWIFCIDAANYRGYRFAAASSLIIRLSQRLVITLYVLARLYLIVESFISLRALPPSAFQTVQWTSFIPHV